MQSSLWMMKGEDASLGNRVVQYDDERYCMEAYNTLDGSVCKPSYLINGWNSSDGFSVADRTSLTTTYDPAGEGDGEHIVGPIADTTNNAVYYITQTCADDDESRRLATTVVWKVKLLLSNQIIPDGSTSEAESCANESYVFAVNRYDLETQKFSMVYAALRDAFPAPDKFNAHTWKIAHDPIRERLYWWYYAGSCAAAKTCDAPLYYISLAGLTDEGDMPTPVLAATVNDGYGHWYWDMTIDDDGNIYLMDWYHIVKFDPTDNSLTTLWEEEYLTTGYHFTGLTWWKDSTLLVSYTNDVTSKLQIYDFSAASGSEWSTLYYAIYYEFSNLGQTLYNLAIDVSHDLLYVATSGGNSAARSIIELPLSPSGLTSSGVAACMNAYDIRCPFYSNGERLVVGHMSAAFTVVGTGKAANFAPGSADRFPASGTSQIAVFPKTTGAYPEQNPCSLSSKGTLSHLKTRLAATERTRCGQTSTTGFDTRHILYTVDAGDKFPNYVLRDFVGMHGLRTASDGSFGYDTQSQYRKYEFWQEIDTSGGNLEDFPGLKSEWGYGHAVKGPAVDLVHGYVYWMSCERAMLPLVCAEWALKRIAISVLETAAAIPNPVDCRFDTCPHSGSYQVLEDRYAVIQPAVEVLYHQSTQLFPGPDDTRTQTTKLAIDPDAEIIYWLVAKPSAGYSAVMFLDVKGWTADDAPFEPCEVGEVAGHYEYGAWTSLAVACDGTLLSHEIDRLKSLDPSDQATQDECVAQGSAWFAMSAEEKQNWKGCWTTQEAGNCNPIFATGYDPSSDKIYFSCGNGRVVPIRRMDRSDEFNGTSDEVVYSGVYYEWPPRADKGSALISHIAIDDLNKELFVANYYGSSAYQAVVRLPLPENELYPGSNSVVHKDWLSLMALVDEDDAPIACLYGHESIEHSMGWGNKACEYTGERMSWYIRKTGMDVILPNPEGIKRFYITETSSSLFVLPAKKSVMAAIDNSKVDYGSNFKLIPHTMIKQSKLNGWSIVNVAVTWNDLGWLPTHQFCAEICMDFWRKGSSRCVGFTWQLSDRECHDMVQKGLLPKMTHDDCSYSNSGLSCYIATVPLTDATADDYTAWPHPCLTIPTEDSDGNGWLTGATGYAPEEGWPSYVKEGYISGQPERYMTYLLKDELFDLEGGESLRATYRNMIPKSEWYGSTDSGDYARFPGDEGDRIFSSSAIEASNPKSMPTASASCWTEVVPDITTDDTDSSDSTGDSTGDSTDDSTDGTDDGDDEGDDDADGNLSGGLANSAELSCPRHGLVTAAVLAWGLLFVQ